MRRLFTTLAAAAAVAASISVTVVTPATAQPAPPESSTSARGGGVTPNAQLPEAIRVDETKFRVVATQRGVGKQVYDCKGTTFGFREPIAGLLNSRGVPTGIHGAGPFWADFDGSKVVGTSPVSVPSPAGPSNVAWLKVTAASTAGTGVFGKVAFIQRVDTRGGVAPASCTEPATASVDYVTNYVFWAPK